MLIILSKRKKFNICDESYAVAYAKSHVCIRYRVICIYNRILNYTKSNENIITRGQGDKARVLAQT